MGKVEIQLQISESKVAAWVADRLGIKRVIFPRVEAAEMAIDEVLKENSLYGTPFTLTASSRQGELSLVISGEGQDFKRICQLLEKLFSPTAPN